MRGVLAGCAGGAGDDIAGACADAHGADVCTWATMEGDAVVAVGATIPLASIEGAPVDAPMMWPP